MRNQPTPPPDHPAAATGPIPAVVGSATYPGSVNQLEADLAPHPEHLAELDVLVAHRLEHPRVKQ